MKESQLAYNAVLGIFTLWLSKQNGSFPMQHALKEVFPWSPSMKRRWSEKSSNTEKGGGVQPSWKPEKSGRHIRHLLLKYEV